MPNPFDWTEPRIAMLRSMWADNEPLSEIGGAIGCCHTTVNKKSRELGLARRRYVVKHFKPNLSPADARAAHQRFIAEDRRSPGEIVMGDPPLERSALMQAQSIPSRSQPRISLGSMGRPLPTRAHGLGALTQHLNRLRRDKSNGSGTHKAIIARKARREREARA